MIIGNATTCIGSYKPLLVSIQNPFLRPFFVPGGHYLVIFSPRRMTLAATVSVYDMGHSLSCNCNEISSIGLPIEAGYEDWSSFTVQPRQMAWALRFSCLACKCMSISFVLW